LFDPSLLRTIFIQFENEDWESELEVFNNTDVEVPATVTVDGHEYPLCGIRFRGASSYFTVPTGYKRSFNVSLDYVHDKQRLYGYKTLNLLNCHGDPSFMSTVLYSALASKHIAVPKANFVRVVINGESWGIYTSAQQFNKTFLKENYGSKKGARWKVNGSPRGGGGLDYRGPDPDSYLQPYEMKQGDAEDTERLIELCRILDEVPPHQLEAALQDKVDINGLLWFLAYDVALCNSDGYWIRASDYSIFLDKQNRFHFVPHDMNEAFRVGGPGHRSHGEAGPDPLIGMEDPRKPLRSKLLAVPKFRQQYLENIRIIGEELKWENLGPRVAGFRQLIDEEIKADTRKLSSYEQFVIATADAATSTRAASADRPSPNAAGPPRPPRPGTRGTFSLREFANRRSDYLLKTTNSHPATVRPDQKNKHQ